MKKQKLLIVSLDEFPHCGGKSTHIASLIAGLNELNVECDVFAGNNINKNSFNILKLLVYPVKFISKKKYLYYRKLFQVYLFDKALRKYVKSKTYDMVSFQDAITCSYCGNLFENNFLTMHTYFGIEYTLDGSGFTLEDKDYKKLLNLELDSLKNTKNVICVDERIKEHVESYIDKQNINVFSIPNFTNTDVFNNKKEKHDKKIIMCVRRLVEKNGVIYAVKAMKHVKSDNCILKVYGDGPAKEEIEACIKNEKLENKVMLCGAIDNSELAKLYNSSDIVVVPSITVNGLQEATSISAIESMSAGLPTIASNIGGLPLLIKNDETGILVTEQEPKQIASAIDDLINNPEKYDEISKNGRNYILKNHSHIMAAKKYLKIFKGDR